MRALMLYLSDLVEKMHADYSLFYVLDYARFTIVLARLNIGRHRCGPREPAAVLHVHRK